MSVGKLEGEVSVMKFRVLGVSSAYLICKLLLDSILRFVSGQRMLDKCVEIIS